MQTLSRRFLLSAGPCLAGGLAHASNAQPPKPAALPVVGLALPRSGDLSVIGDECLRGIQLAADAVNLAGGVAGKPVVLAAADTVAQTQAGAAVSALISAQHAELVLSGGDSDLAYPASAAAELAQVPFIELNAPADGITARGFKYLLRTGPTTRMIAALAVSSLLARFPGRKVGLLFNTGASGGAIVAAALAAFAAAKVPVQLAIGYPADVIDLHDPVGRLQRAGVEVVLHAAGPSDVLAFFQAMQAQGWQPQAVLGCGAGYGLRENAIALGVAFAGTLVVAAPFYPPEAAAIAQAYVTRFGMVPQSPDSLTAYVGAKLALTTLSAQGGDPGKLLNAMRKTNLPLGGLENGFGVAFDLSGQNTRSLVTLQQWRNQTLIPAA
jgi:branched-chain amino acid transport system substrate-binding protein